MVDSSATRESVVSATPWLLYLQQRDPVSTFQEEGWTSEQVCMGPENLALSGFKPQTIQPISSNYTPTTLSSLVPSIPLCWWLLLVSMAVKHVLLNLFRSLRTAPLLLLFGILTLNHTFWRMQHDTAVRNGSSLRQTCNSKNRETTSGDSSTRASAYNNVRRWTRDLRY